MELLKHIKCSTLGHEESLHPAPISLNHGSWNLLWRVNSDGSGRGLENRWYFRGMGIDISALRQQQPNLSRVALEKCQPNT